MATEEAVRKRISLGEASLARANLYRAILTRRQLASADLSQIRADIETVLAVCPEEVAALREALEAGRINGLRYDIKCCGLAGALAEARDVPCESLPGVTPNSTRPAERWFLAIRPGHTPSNNPIAAITAGWIDQWLDQHGITP